jgi:hypothetical protein
MRPHHSRLVDEIAQVFAESSVMTSDIRREARKLIIGDNSHVI